MNFDSLKDQVSNLTLYDIKAGVRKVQNGTLVVLPKKADCYSAICIAAALLQIYGSGVADSITAVMNYTEMEAKVS